jgi:hypothetical protein
MIGIVQARSILDFGKLYNPAWMHYKQGAVVVCDFCGRDHLVMAIGYKEHDLCLSCADMISMNRESELRPSMQRIRQPIRQSNPTIPIDEYSPVTRMVQDSAFLYPVTRMEQDQCTPRSRREYTMMEQDCTKPRRLDQSPVTYSTDMEQDSTRPWRNN